MADFTMERICGDPSVSKPHPVGVFGEIQAPGNILVNTIAQSRFVALTFNHKSPFGVGAQILASSFAFVFIFLIIVIIFCIILCNSQRGDIDVKLTQRTIWIVTCAI